MSARYSEPEWRDAGEIECIYITGEPADRVPSFSVGHGGVTRIEKWTKSGSMAALPYVRVWKGDVMVAEFCQHNLSCVFFRETPPNATAIQPTKPWPR